MKNEKILQIPPSLPLRGDLEGLKIIITQPFFFQGEKEQMENHFLEDENLVLHLRKPDSAMADYENLLQSINPKYHSRIVLHEHYDLHEKYNIRGLHFSTSKRELRKDVAHNISTSTSCHALDEIKSIENEFDYTFLSPIFPSISKQGYHGNLDMEKVKDFLQQKRKIKVIALGGIIPERLQQIDVCGFDGYAMLGAAWKIPLNPLKGNFFSDGVKFPFRGFRGKISKLQYITQNNNTLSHAEQARLMFENGVSWVQIRMKNVRKEKIAQQVEEALKYAKEFGGTIIVNDHVDICLETQAHGVHVGLSDCSVSDARNILGENFIIGGTANTIDDIELHVKNGADYIGLGPFRFTTTKQNLSTILGEKGYRDIADELEKRNIFTPIIAVGGIEMHEIETLKSCGLHGVAISSSLLKMAMEQIK
ncbi:MAG: thiamine phosphate synthase [Bacteroidales bacterium]|nr:thiamine phosphate synthase [Bacteroidales bacterium]